SCEGGNDLPSEHLVRTCQSEFDSTLHQQFFVNQAVQYSLTIGLLYMIRLPLGRQPAEDACVQLRSNGISVDEGHSSSWHRASITTCMGFSRVKHPSRCQHEAKNHATPQQRTSLSVISITDESHRSLRNSRRLARTRLALLHQPNSHRPSECD